MTRANKHYSYTEDELKEINNIKRFLVENEFKLTTVEILDSYAKLIFKSLITINLIVKDEYKELAAVGTNCESYRIKLTYHGKINHPYVRNSILNKYGYDIGKDFMGLKYFIEQLAIVYSIYTND